MESHDDLIAIVGVGLRFPQASTTDEFWSNLLEGKDCLETLTDEELVAAGAKESELRNPSFVRRVSRLRDVEMFDAEFFGFTPRDAGLADPQLRVLLEVAHEALEDSGHALAGGSVGVYLATADNEHWLSRQIYHTPDRPDEFLGNRVLAKKDYFAMQLAHKLDLRGPAINLTTTCSSGVVALHEAVNNLLLYNCDYALAGACEISQPRGYVYSEGGIDSADGVCRPFDAAATGTVFGSGAGMILMRRYADAVRDGDHVYALIRAVGLNNDGRPKPGFAAPSASGQAAVIHETLMRAGITAEDVSYVEAHGTGTPVGDPIEVEALTRVFREFTDRRQFCALGSVKSNFGHLSIAAGIAGVIKVALALKHRMLPATLHVEEPNPRIDFKASPFFLNTELRPWEVPAGAVRCAGVSAFGIGGTNAHVILQEAPAVPARGATRAPALLVATGKSEAAAKELARRIDGFLASDSATRVSDVAYTLQVGRQHLDLRSWRVVPEGIATAGEPGAGWSAAVAVRHDPKVAFLFPGQGSQYLNMARGLYELPVFRAELDACADALAPHLGADIRSIIFAPLGEDDGPDSPLHERLQRTRHTQPALFSVSYALAKQLMSWGVNPAVMLGHSLGEYVAACLAGVFELEDCLGLVAARGAAMEDTAPGAMLSVSANVADVQRHVTGDVAVAAINGPESCVLSGPAAAIEAIAETLAAENVGVTRLRTSRAFHSPSMEPALDRYRAAFAGVALQAPRIPFYSNVTGKPIEAAQATDPEYWVSQIRQPVNFHDAVQRLAGDAGMVALEVGPGTALSSLIRAADSPLRVIPAMRKAKSEQPDEEHLLGALGALWAEGVQVEWEGLYHGSEPVRVALPKYPFQRSRHMPEERRRQDRRGRSDESFHPLLGARWAVTDEVQSYEGWVSPSEPPYLADHKLVNTPIFPGAGYLEMALAMGAATDPRGGMAVEEINFAKPLLFGGDEGRSLQAVATFCPGEAGRFQILNRPGTQLQKGEQAWVVHSRGRFAPRGEACTETVDVEAIRGRMSVRMDVDAFYAGMEFVSYGPTFRALSQMWRGDREGLARVELPRSLGEPGADYVFHPVLADATFQVAGTMLDEYSGLGATLPVRLKGVRVYERIPRSCWAHATIVSGDDAGLFATIRIISDDGRVIGEIDEYHQQAVELPESMDAAADEDPVYELRWVRQDAPAATGNEAARTLVIAGAGASSRDAAARLQGALADLGPADVVELSDSEALEDLPARLEGWAQATAGRRRNVVVLGALDGGQGALDLAWQGLGVVKALSDVSFDTAPRLWLVTAGCHAVEEGERVPLEAAAQGALWGLATTVRGEHPELRCTTLDFGAADVDVQALAAEVAASDREERVAYRGGRRFVMRIDQLAKDEDAGLARPEGRYHLGVREFGTFDNLYLADVAVDALAPGLAPDQVEVEMKAAPLNFKECLFALGKIPVCEAGDLRFGFEGAGTVIRAGSQVSTVEVGDEVIVYSRGCLASHHVVRQHEVIRKPAILGWSEAAALPTVFMTAYYALHEVARIRAGDRVLIHAAAGGVGQAAVQIAQAVGAEVYASASHPKWEFLRAQGVRHIVDSRDPGFVEAIRGASGGAGVDIVLNSLTGDFIQAGFDVLAEGGRFVEIGKLGIWTDEEARAYRPDVDYTALEIGEGEAGGDHQYRRLMELILAGFERGDYRALPQKEFALEEVVDAFRFLASGKNVGKVIISLDGEGAGETLAPAPGAAYVVTGGLGALGLHVAELLAERGASKLVLLARRAPSEAVEERLETLRAAGAEVVVENADVASMEEMAAVFQRAEPVAGVFHCAGVLRDGILRHLDREGFETVFRSKVDGSLVLHELTKERGLDWFVTFSSTSAVIDGAGQGNYAAANAFMDGLARHRAGAGLPALSINWGAWEGEGMAASLGLTGRHRLIGKEEGQAALERLLLAGRTEAVVAKLRGRRMKTEDALFELLGDAPGAAAGGAGEWPNRIARAAEEQLQELLVEFVQGEVGKVLGVPPTSVKPDTNFVDAGIDSLMMTELRNNVQRGVGVQIRAASFFAHPTVTQLSAFLSGQIVAARAPGDAAPASASTATAVAVGDRAAGPPVFCIPGIADSVYDFTDLAAIEDRGYGVVVLAGAPADRTADDVRHEFVRLAAEYAKVIVQTEPRGPYRLVGFSFGGSVAAEVANQLTIAGHEVSLLLLVDSFAYVSLTEAQKEEELKRLFVKTAVLETLAPTGTVPAPVLVRFGEARADLELGMEIMDGYLDDRTREASLDLAAVAQMVEDFGVKSNLAGYAGPRSLNGTKVKLVRCVDGPFSLMNQLGERGLGDHDGTIAYGWDRLVHSEVEVLPVSCSHSEAMRFPHVETIHQALLASGE